MAGQVEQKRITGVFPPFRKSFLIVLSVLAMFGVLTVSIRTITINNTMGADYFIYYMAGKGFLSQHLSPYDPEITLNTEMAVLGRPSAADEDQLAFVYPAFGLVPLLPFFLPDFGWSQALWMSANLTLMGLVILALAARYRSRLAFGFFCFYPVAFGLVLGNLNLTICTALVFLLSVLVLNRRAPPPGLQWAAGFLFAWTMIKPQFMWFFAIFLLLNAIKSHYFIFLYATFASLAVLAGFSLILWPGWVADWLARVRSYAGYVHSKVVILASLEQVLPESTAQIVTGILGIAAVGVTIWLLRSWWRENTPANRLTCLAWIGFATYCFHPNGTSYEQMVMLVPFLFWALNGRVTSSWIKPLLWAGAIILSWLAFALSISKLYPRAEYDLPLLFFAGWTIWILAHRRETAVLDNRLAEQR